MNNNYGDGKIIGSSHKLSENYLKYLKYQDMSTAPFCSKPNCTHKTDDCLAKAVGNCPILTKNGVFFFSDKYGVEEKKDGKREFEIDSKLCRASLDSSEIETVAEFTDCVPREYDGCMVIDGVLWFTGDDMNPITNEYGAIISSNVGGTHYLCSIDLKTGEYTNYGSVYNGENYDKSSHASIVGYYNSNLLINYEYAASPDYEDPSAPWFGLSDLMFEFDPKTKEMKVSDIPSRPIFFDLESETLAYCEYDANKIIVLADNKRYELNMDIAKIDGGIANYAPVYNNKIIMLGSGKWYDITDQSEHYLGEYAGWDFEDYYDGCYILSNPRRTKYVKLTEEELLALK